MNLTAYLLLKKRQFSKALVEVDRCLALSIKRTTELHRIDTIGYKAEIFTRLNDMEAANKTMLQIQKIQDEQGNIPATLIGNCFVVQFLIDMYQLKKINLPEKNQQLSSLKKKAYKSGKAAISKLKMYAPSRPKALRLMGEYYWLISKQKKALKWWSKSIKDAECLGSRLHLSRTYFEIGKSLLEPNSKYKDLNGITAEEYLAKARTLFEEMALQWDLDELDKVMAAR